jgi:DNA invertase Pin-like site-specific DNA recombinase
MPPTINNGIPHPNDRIGVSKIEVVYIRKSTSAQETEDQIANVKRMLEDMGKHVPDEWWFADTGSRRHAHKRKDFQRLMSLVNPAPVGGRKTESKIGTIYIESQSRWGGKDRKQLFGWLSTLAENGVKLFDLKDRRELTSSDMATELNVYINSLKSEKELEDLAFNSMRAKVGKLERLGAWVGGRPPFGYDKVCISVDGGEQLWRFHHTSHYRGEIHYPNGLVRVDNCPRKSKQEYTRLALSIDPEESKIVQDIFHWWITENISRRGIALRLNDTGRLHYGKPWTHETVGDILKNPQFTGDTYYGRHQFAEIYTFDAKGIMTPVKEKLPQLRPLDECRVKKDTHPAIVTRQVWEQAQVKLKEAPSFPSAPRNGKRWLKGILYCGHCGVAMTTRPYNGRVVYICKTYDHKRVIGHKLGGKCHAYTIDHADAEALVMDHLNSLGASVGEAATASARIKMDAELQLLGEIDGDRQKVHDLFRLGIADYLVEIRKVMADLPEKEESNLKQLLVYFVSLQAKGISFDVGLGHDNNVSEQVRRIEDEKVRAAKQQLANLEKRHANVTNAWSEANEIRRPILDAQLKKMEAEICKWQERAIPLWKRIENLDAAVQERMNKIAHLQTEWEEMGDRQRAEQVRQIVRKCVLFWEAIPWGSKKRYSVLTDRTEWVYAKDGDSTLMNGGCA